MINLRTLPITYISLPEDSNRRDTLLPSLSYLDNPNILMSPGMRDSSVRRGCTLAHITALEKQDSTPFLILEDDCVLLKQLDTIDPPEDADAIYLGISGWGRTSGNSCEGINIGKTVGQFTRIYNMLSTHAILYLSKKYVHESIITCKKSYDADAYVDVALADTLQKNHNVYALTHPMFYQSSSADITKNNLFSYKTFE